MENNLSYYQATLNRVDTYLNRLINLLGEWTTPTLIHRTRMDQVRLTSTLTPMEFMERVTELEPRLGFTLGEYSIHILQDGGDSASWTITITIFSIDPVS